MNPTFSIAKKEFRDYFGSPIAYVYLVVFLIFLFWFFFAEFFIQAQATLRGLFTWAPLIFLIFLPAVTMSKWSEEKKAGTLEVLLTLPVTDWQVILGKFLACLLFLMVSIAFTLPVVITVSFLGEIDWGPVIGGYLGLILLGSTCLAIGLFFSSLTDNAIIAFILSFVVLLLVYIMGEPVILNYVPNTLAPLFATLSLSYHFKSIARGLIDSRDLLYYFSLIGFFLYLNVLSLEARKWDR